MGLKDEFTKVVDKVKDTAESVKDAASEAMHRGAAKVEQSERHGTGRYRRDEARRPQEHLDVALQKVWTPAGIRIMVRCH